MARADAVDATESALAALGLDVEEDDTITMIVDGMRSAVLATTAAVAAVAGVALLLSLARTLLARKVLHQGKGKRKGE